MRRHHKKTVGPEQKREAVRHLVEVAELREQREDGGLEHGSQAFA